MVTLDCQINASIINIYYNLIKHHVGFLQENFMGSMVLELLNFLQTIMGYKPIDHALICRSNFLCIFVMRWFCLCKKLTVSYISYGFFPFLSKVLRHNNSHLASTYCALAILKIVGYDFSSIDSEAILTSMRNLQQPDGR